MLTNNDDLKTMNQRIQTCRKSTSGIKRTTSSQPQRMMAAPSTSSRRTSDSSITSQPQSLGLKLVFKRQSGDKYEISSPASSTGGDSHPIRKVSF